MGGGSRAETVPAANSTTTINGIEIKFGLVVRNDEVIN